MMLNYHCRMEIATFLQKSPLTCEIKSSALSLILALYCPWSCSLNRQKLKSDQHRREYQRLPAQVYVSYKSVDSSARPSNERAR